MSAICTDYVGLMNNLIIIPNDNALPKEVGLLLSSASGAVCVFYTKEPEGRLLVKGWQFLIWTLSAEAPDPLQTGTFYE